MTERYGVEHSVIRPMRWCIAALALVLGCSVAADVIRVPEDVLSVQHAIDRAKAGDTIDVAPGRYREAIDLRGKSILVQGRDGAASTIIDATGLDESVVRCITAEGPGTVLVGMTFTGGTGHRGLRGIDTALGGGLLALGASPTIRDCVFLENSASHNGGGAYCGPAADVRFEQCRFESNTAEKGGGLLSVSSRPVMIDCVFKSNEASYCGGGLFAAKGSRPVLRGCSFITNRAAYQGGGACSLDSAGEILDSSFERNRAGSHGGAVYFGFRTSMEASGCTFKTATDSIDGVHQVAYADKRVGACSLGNGVCVVAEASDCEAAGGAFRGAEHGGTKVQSHEREVSRATRGVFARYAEDGAVAHDRRAEPAAGYQPSVGPPFRAPKGAPGTQTRAFAGTRFECGFVFGRKRTTRRIRLWNGGHPGHDQSPEEFENAETAVARAVVP